MVCSFCDSAFDMEELLTAEDIRNQQSEDASPSTLTSKPAWDVVSGGGEVAIEREQEGLRAWTCPSCAGEIIGDANTLATRCPYCDNNAIIASQMEGDFHPDYVIPFRKTKEDAQTAYLQNAKKRLLLPKDYATQSRLEDITGMYVPFWLYSCKAHGSFQFEATTETDQGSRIKIDHYDVQRTGTLSFNNIPADASKSINDTYMEAIEPFDYSELKAFNTAYLSGHLADRYDVEHQENQARITQRLERGAEEVFSEPVREHYDSCSTAASQVDITSQDVKQAMLPVWLLNARYEDRLYSFAMNGQTGEFIGELPVSRSRQIMFGLLFLLPCILVACLLCALFIDTSGLTMALGALVGILIDGLIIWIITKGINTAQSVDTATNYLDALSINYEMQDDQFVRTTYRDKDDD